jgi:hypothetical protein
MDTLNITKPTNQSYDNTLPPDASFTFGSEKKKFFLKITRQPFRG